MPAQKWTTPEQLAFLIAEDAKWPVIKAGANSLKGFYLRTAKTFLEKWPAVPDTEVMKEAGNDPVKAKEIVEAQLLSVSPILVLP